MKTVGRLALILGPILLAAYLIVTQVGFEVELRNHTAREFPWTCEDKLRWSEVLYPAITPQEVALASADHRHKFLLEISHGWAVWNVKAVVIVNNQAFPMTEYVGTEGKGLFVYMPDAADCGTEVYKYSFGVTYGVGFRGAQRQLAQVLEDSGGVSFKAPVLGSHRWVWWSTKHDPAAGDGVVHLQATEEGCGWRESFHVQNLNSNPMRISFIGLLANADSAKFRLDSLPGSEELRCQESLTFRMTWTPTPPDFEDSTSIVVYLEYYVGGQWVEYSQLVIRVTTQEWQQPA